MKQLSMLCPPPATAKPCVTAESERMKCVEERWERALWASRMIVLVAVVCSLLLALVALVLGAADTLAVVADLIGYLSPTAQPSTRESLRGDLVASIVKAVDAFLIGAVLVVVALGLYELFINRIESTEGSESAARVLLIRNLDDLKDRMSRLVLLILIVEFFGMALRLSVQGALDLLLLALGIFLVAASVFLTTRGAHE